MEYIKNTFQIIKYNFNTLLKFEILFKLLLGIIFIPVAIGGFSLTMKLTGYSYLTLENILNFFLNPLTIFLLLLVILFLTIITLFDISTMIIIYDASYHKNKIKVKEAMKLSLNKCRKLLKIRNIPVAFMLVFLIPFLNFGVGSNVISSIKIPEFILDYIDANGVLSLILITLYIILVIILLKWIYSIHYMVLEDNEFKQAKKSSKNLAKGNKLKDIVRIIFIQLIMYIMYITFILIGILIIYALNKILANIKILESIIITIIGLFIALSLIIFSILSNASSYALISALFYLHKTKINEEIKKIDYSKLDNDDKKKNKFRYIVLIVVLLAIIGGSGFTYQVITGQANLNIEFIRNMEITAHRGASKLYPENTMSAFRGAKELGADWIELDVQQTKDCQIVVSHDTNLKRVTDVNKNIIDLNYDEICKLDAGSFFSDEFKGEKIPLLEDVLKFAKENKIRLNIELKPIGKEIDFEKQVIELIKKYNFENMCVITSQTYSVLENTKKIDSNIKTVYVMSIAIGNITDLEYADAFSVEASNVTDSLVSQVHNEGKELLVWTVNTEESINEMINMNVDNIITDNIVLGKELVIQSKHSDFIIEFLKMLSN